MNDLIYTPDVDVKVHEEGAIRLICSGFQSHEVGLPELLKNSADAYARQDTDKNKRLIIVIINSEREGYPASISCLDFVGMDSKIIENNFRHWADPEAASGGDPTITVQGGHGNGGKCYMTQMFEEYSLIHTVCNGIGNRYGVKGESIHFGYIPDRKRGRDFPVDNLNTQLELALKVTRCTLGTVWKVAKHAIRDGKGFTLVTGVGPKGYRDKLPTRTIIENLRENTQMIRTLELCRVLVVENGKVFKRGEPLTLPKIKAINGEKPRCIPIPETLINEKTGEEVSTRKDGELPGGTLTLLTSQRSMRYSKKGRHNIIYIAQSGYIGHTQVLEFDVISPYASYIYGECELMALEPYKQNDRINLSDSPLTRAVRRFISDQIQEYGEVFEARDRRKSDHEEKNALDAMNEALDQWKNRFFSEIMQGMWGGPGPGPKPPDRQPLPSGKLARMELVLSYQRAGNGISLKPAIRFFDADDRRIRSVPYRWVSDDNNVAMVDEDLMLINTFSYGKTDIYAKTLDGTVRSNIIPLEVVRIHEINVVPNKIEISAGSRHNLKALCHLANGEIISEIYLDWISTSSEIAGVNSSGTVFGINPGETVVTAGDGKCDANNPTEVKVIPGHGKGSGQQRGKGFPRVLISGEFHHDPDTKEYRYLNKHHPPVWQDAKDADRNIWWINSDAALARLYLDRYGYKSREWRMYFVERYIEAICQMVLTHGPDERANLSVGEWLYQWGDQVATIQSAASAELIDFISKGDLPV